jgi:hypothetical protein
VRPLPCRQKRRSLLVLAVAKTASIAPAAPASTAEGPTARASATLTACAGKGGALRAGGVYGQAPSGYGVVDEIASSGGGGATMPDIIVNVLAITQGQVLRTAA